MKYLLFSIALLIQPKTNEYMLGTLLAIDSNCTKLDIVGFDAWKCDGGYSRFQMYVSTFIDTHSDLEQITSWLEVTPTSYVVTISYDDELYNIVYSSRATSFTITKHQME